MLKRLGVLLVLGLFASYAAAAPPSEEIAGLVRGLASPDWKERDVSEARLAEIGLPAQRPLEEAAQSKDEELAWRARRVLAVITRTRLTICLETADGKPAGGTPLQLSLVRTDGTGALGIQAPEDAKADAMGRFQLRERPESGTYLLQLGAAGFLPVKVEPLRLAGGDRNVFIRLEKGVKVSGTLRFADGKPAAGVALGLFPCMEPAQLHRYAEIGNRRECTAGKDGRFAFEPAPEGEYRLLVEAGIGTLKARILLLRSLLLKEGETIGNLALALPEDPAKSPGLREAVLSGRCTDAAGAPLSGRMMIYVDGVAGWPELTDEVPVDAKGAFEALVPPGIHRLSAALPGTAPTTIGPLSLAPGPNPPVALVLGPGGSLTGKVVDPTGTAVPGAEIAHYHPGRLEAGTPETSLSRFDRADKQGRFSTLHAMPGVWEVRAFSDEHGLGVPQTILVEPGKARDLKLVVPKGTVARGRVLSEDGTPCAKASLIAFAEAWDNHAGDPWEPYSSATAESGPEGGFEMVLPFEGPWRIVAEKEGFRPGAAAFSVKDGRATEGLSIRLAPERPGRIVVKAVDAAGAPVPGAQVQILSLHPLRAPARTDARGGALLDHLPPGTYTVLAAKAGLAPGMATAELAEDAEAGLTCVLREGSRLSGRLLDVAGKPLAAHPVWAWRADFSLRHVEEQVGALAWEAMTDAEGRYAFAHLPPGRLKVMPAPDGKADPIWTGAVPPEDRPVEGVDFKLGDGVLVSVKVSDARGRPVANAAVEAYPAGALTNPYSVDLYAVAFTDEKGLAVLTGLPAGEKADLLVSHPEQAWAFLKGQAATPGPLPVVLGAGERCEGRLDFKPPAVLGPALREDVFVLALGDHGAGKTRVREDGRFVFERLLPGEYEVFLTVGNRRLAGVRMTVEAGKEASCHIPVVHPLPRGTP